MVNRRMLTLGASLLFACGGSEGAGCTPGNGYGSNGEIGQGAFDYACADDDQLCSENQPLLTLSQPPAPIAQGATFGLRFRTAADASETSPRLVAAVGVVFEPRADRFFARQVGLEPVLALESTGTRVIDLVHVQVSTPEDIVIEGPSPSPVILLGAEHTMRAVIRGRGVDAGAPVVLGGIAAKFQIADESVVGLRSQRNGRARLVGQRVGETKITASFAEHQVTSTIRVTANVSDAGADVDANADADAAEGGSDAKAD